MEKCDVSKVTYYKLKDQPNMGELIKRLKSKNHVYQRTLFFFHTCGN